MYIHINICTCILYKVTSKQYLQTNSSVNSSVNLLWAAWHSDSVVGHIYEVVVRRARLVLEWVTMSRFNSATQVNSAWPSLCVDAMSTGQWAVMLCGWKVKAGMAGVWWRAKL